MKPITLHLNTLSEFWRPPLKTRDEARRDIVGYIEMFYNSKRRHSYMCNISPRRFEEMRQAHNAD